MIEQPFDLPPDHPEIREGKVGVLIVNLGTPDDTDYWSMRRYLKEFLSDPRVIEVNRALWWVILNGIILTTRPSKSGAAYRSIWNEELDESPLRTITRSQTEKLASKFAKNKHVIVEWAMRYGNPSMEVGIKSLKDQGCDKILFCPLYPQYSAATTATANDKAFDVLKTQRWQPAVRTLPPYFETPEFITALANSLKSHISSLKWKPDLILASYHGVPEEYLLKGDPYHCQCVKTTRLLREHLKWGEDKLVMAFQSRFGKAEWIKPYTDKSVEELAKQGLKNLVVITPGFSSDCVETLEEIALEAGEDFLDNGGKNFSVVPCLNDSTGHITMLEKLVRKELGGWL